MSSLESIVRNKLNGVSPTLCVYSNVKEYLATLLRFHKHGCAIVKNFASASECDLMREEMSKLIDKWDPKSVTTFRTEKQELARIIDYFLDSASYPFFCEPGL